MMRLGKVLLVCLLALLLLSLSPGALAAKKYNIGVVFYHATRSGWNQGVAEGVKLGFAKYKNVNWTLADSMSDAQRQVSNIESMISKRVDGMIVVGGYTATLNNTLAKVREAKIPLTTVDIPSPSTMINVTSDNEMMGKAIAMEIVKLLNGKGKIMVIFSPGWPAMDIRRQMFGEVLKGYPDLKMVAECPWDITNLVPKMMADTEAVIGQHPDLNVIWTPCDAMGLICAQAVNGKGLAKQIKIFAFDGDPTALQELRKESSFYMTMAQDTHKLGSTAVDFLMDILKGKAKNLKPEYYVPSMLVTRENVIAAAEKLLGKDFWKQ